MSNLTLLPLLKVNDGVQTNEDWQLAIAFYLNDGVTPITLQNLSFTLTVGELATFVSGSDNILVTGPSSNLLLITVLSTQKLSWSTGIYPLSLTVSDGVYTRDLFAFSNLTVGATLLAHVSLIVAPDVVPHSVVSPISSALANAFQALQPASISAALAALPGAELSLLTQALLGALTTQSGSSAPVPSGQAFVNESGYVVFAQ